MFAAARHLSLLLKFRARKDDDDGWAGRRLALGREHENHHHQVPRYITS